MDFPLLTVARRLPLWKWDLIWALGEANACQPWSSYEPDGKGNYHRLVYVIGEGDTLEVSVLLDRSNPVLENSVDSSHLALHCSPAVNLFEKRTDRIQIGDQSL